MNKPVPVSKPKPICNFYFPVFIKKWKHINWKTITHHDRRQYGDELCRQYGDELKALRNTLLRDIKNGYTTHACIAHRLNTILKIDAEAKRFCTRRISASSVTLNDRSLIL